MKESEVPARPSTPPFPAANTPSSGLRALVADDHVDSAESLAAFLNYAGVETQTVSNGEQALALATAWKPHICVLDILMPKLDGREVARQVREQAWETRPLLIAVTGWDRLVNEKGATGSSFDHWLTKPVDPVKLADLIQRYFGLVPDAGHR
jgi:CheY-like chemotaxis protein